MKTIKGIITAITIVFLTITTFANPFNYNHELPNGVVFQLKIGPFHNALSSEVISKFEVVNEYENERGHWCTAGIYSTHEQATVKENSLKFNGIECIEIVAYFNKRNIAVEDAMTLLDNQNKVDEEYVMKETIPVSQLDKMLETKIRGANLYYSIKLRISSYEEADKTMDLLDDYDIKVTDKQKNEYSIGKFEHIKEAMKVQAAFEEVGLEKVFIVAYVNDERVSYFEAVDLETMKQEAYAEVISSIQ